MILVTILILHVLTASAWFGLSIRLGSQAKLAASGQPAIALDGSRTISYMGIMIIATFVFSMTLLIVGGGYSGQVQYHIASALIVVLLGVQFIFLRPTWKRLQEAIDVNLTKEDSKLGTSQASKQARKISAFTGVGHLVWLILLILMFWNRVAILS